MEEPTAAAAAEPPPARPPLRGLPALGGHARFIAQLDMPERLICAARSLFMLLQIAVYLAILVVSRNDRASFIFRSTLILDCAVMSFILLAAPRYFQVARRTDQNPELIEAENIRRSYINTFDTAFSAIFVLAAVCIFAIPGDIANESPMLYYTNVALIALRFMYYGAPLVLCVLVIAFLPCLFLLGRHMVARQANVFDGRMGASEDLINAIPIVRFRKKILPAHDIESPNEGAHQAAGSPGASKSNGTATPAQHLHPVDPAAASAHDEIESSSNPYAAMPPDASLPAPPVAPTHSGISPPTSSPSPRLTSSTQPVQPQTSRIKSRPRRRFNLLPNIFRRNPHDANAESASAQNRTTELELDPEDAVCVICLCEYDDGESLRQLTCSHHFHVKCIDDWLKVNAKCPLCVRSLKKDSKETPTSSIQQAGASDARPS